MNILICSPPDDAVNSINELETMWNEAAVA
jgi:hypothetical protein